MATRHRARPAVRPAEATDCPVSDLERPAPAASQPRGQWLTAALQHRRLGPWLGLCAMLLCAPSLWLGFHLDDYMHRYMLSDLPGAAALLDAYESPFGIANGEPGSLRWQVDQGYAPWWTDDGLLVSLWRPISEATHRLDVALYRDSAPLMHLHSLLWGFLLVVAVTALYRAVLGPTTVAGLAAVFYAFDHAHGFAIGWIANRNALIATAFGAVSLLAFHRAACVAGRAHAWAPDADAPAPGPPAARTGGPHGAPRARDAAAARQATGMQAPPRGRFGGAPWALLSVASLGCALLSGEASVAVTGYLFAHALCLQSGAPLRRLASLLPHAALVVAWRLAYHALGRGAHGSGLYLDPVREPLRFVLAALERGPILLLGQLALPPAEAYVFFPYHGLQLALALGVAALFAWACWPLLRAERSARFWGLGMLLSLLPACATHPNNRLLFFVGLGAMGLLSQLWHGVLGGARWLPPASPLRGLRHALTAALAGFHLVLSPLLLPLSTLGVAAVAPVAGAVEQLLRAPDLGGRTLLLLDAPDYYSTKLIAPIAALQGLPAPARVFALSYGAVPLRVRRIGPRALDVHYVGGLLQRPTDYLYSHPARHMHVGDMRRFADVTVRVTETTADGRPSRAVFEFDRPLDADGMRWVRWSGRRFVPFSFRDLGDRIEQPPAQVPLLRPFE